MDREQAIKIIKDCKEKSFKRTLYTLNEYHEAVDMAIRALEQEPTDAVQRTSNANKKHIENTLEDAISREDVLDEINRIGVKAFETYNDYSELFDFVDSLPSVSTEKTGHLIEHEHNGIAHIECSKCLTWFLRPHLLRNSYCPNCGAKMVEPQESEDKE